MSERRSATDRASADVTPLPPFVGTFLRGLSLGALVGAAIAGSALLHRRRRDAGDGRPVPER